eukprot:tig00021036_g17281.t1
MCRRAATLWLLCLTLLQVALAVDPFGFSVGIWTPLNSTGGGPQPSARRWHSITALDSGSFVLFGGREDGFTSASNGSTSTTQTTRYLNDVWLFTFSAGRKIEWKELVKQEDDLLIPSGRPAARYAHSAIVRRSGGKQFLVIYGGYSPLCGDYCSDMWELDIEAKTWKQWTKYSGSAAAADPYTLKCSPDKWIGRRWRHVAEAYGPYMLVFGGFRSWQDPDESSVGFLNDLWEIDFEARTATRLQPAVSGSFSLSDLSRVSPGSVLNPGSGSGKTGTLFVFGGYRSNSATPADGVWLNDLYSYNHLANEWKLETFANPAGRSTPIPSERYGPTMFAYAEVLGIFGGRDSNNADLGDVWMFNTTSRYWTEFEYKQLVTSAGLWPAGRSRHAGASMGDSRESRESEESSRGRRTRPEGFLGDRVVVFGGSSEGPNIADPWLLDLAPSAFFFFAGVDRCKADCSGHGACVRGYCVCDPGFFGPDCSGRYCPDSTCTYDYVLHKQTCAHCSSRGSCDGSVVDAAGKGLCVCREPSTGYKCELTLCPQNCTVKASVNSLGGGASIPQGTAPFILQYGRIESWDFNAYEPYANGLCNANGTCTCYDPFRGTDCSLRSGCKDVTADNYDAEATVSLDICKHACAPAFE